MLTIIYIYIYFINIKSATAVVLLTPRPCSIVLYYIALYCIVLYCIYSGAYCLFHVAVELFICLQSVDRIFYS